MRNSSAAIGLLVRKRRKAKGLTQALLAVRTGMTPVQLCKIEKGHSSPTIETVERIAEALELSLADLFAVEDDKGSSVVGIADAESKRFLKSRFICVRYNDDDCAFDSAVLDGIIKVENRACDLSKSLGVPCSTMLPFVHSFRLDANGAKTVARYMRSACAAGAATFSDIAEMLEFRNVRLHLAVLSENIQSRSYFDCDNHSLSIVLSKSDTPERHVYRIAYELAWAVLFGSSGFKPVRETPLRHRFAREFASEFLMPEEAVRFTVSQLGVRLDDWDLTSIKWLKSRFNVSAEAFALRLESLGLISERLRQKIREELHEYYKSHPKAMEPKPALSPLKIGVRLKLLEAAAAKRGVGE